MLGFERVYTITGYHDGPVEGVADFGGRPHAYLRRFDEAADEYGELYELRAVDPETFARVLEAWEIWRRWEAAYHAGKTTLETHPALASDRARHEVLGPEMDARLAALPGRVILARATFATNEEAGSTRRSWRELCRVRWTPVEPSEGKHG